MRPCSASPISSEPPGTSALLDLAVPDPNPTAALPLLALERDGNNALLRRYFYGPALLAMVSGSNTYYFHADRLGSVVNLTSDRGVKQWTWDYGPYGTLRAETKHKTTAPTTLLRYTGQYLHSATAHYHLRARQYDPAIGRFLSVDPVPEPIASSCVGGYVYVRDNPVNLTDPSGRSPDSSATDSCLGVQIAAALGLIAIPPVDIGIATANVAAAPSVVGLAALVPADLGAIWVTQQLIDLFDQASYLPCEEIHLDVDPLQSP